MMFAECKKKYFNCRLLNKFVKKTKSFSSFGVVYLNVGVVQLHVNMSHCHVRLNLPEQCSFFTFKCL